MVDKEWNRLKEIDTWDETNVREYSEVVKEAKANGQTIHTISLEGDIVSALSLSPDGTVLVIATKLGFLRQYTSNDFELVRTWHLSDIEIYIGFESETDIELI